MKLVTIGRSVIISSESTAEVATEATVIAVAAVNTVKASGGIRDCNAAHALY